MFLKLTFLVLLGLAFQKVYADEPESILGGSDATLGEFPYQVSLRVNGFHVCGGTLVSNSHVITAAHCIHDVVDAPYSDLQVVTGTATLNSGGEFHRVRDVRVHPNYKPSPAYSWENDAALIYLERPVRFNAYQRPIPLATSAPPANAALIFSGWGRTATNNGRLPNNLKKATLYYVNNQECQNDHPRMPIHTSQICAVHSYGIGACNGDSGGPLVYQGKLVGIASWVLRCALGAPDVFTRVSEFRNFFGDVRNL